MQSIFPRIKESLIDEIRRAKCVAVIGHKNPDGDALSSTLALKEILISLGKECIALNSGPFKKKELEFLTRDMLTSVPEEFKKKNPLVIVVDCSTSDRPGSAYDELKDFKTIVIDHHSSGREFVPDSLSYIVPDSPSTTLLIEELRVALGAELSKDIARYLYIGLATDTGFFHFLSDKTGAYSFYKASLFASTGINPYEIYDMLNDGKTLDSLKWIASIIENSRMFYSGQLAILIQPEECNADGISDLIYQQMLTVDGIKALVYIKHKDDKFELGFRAKRNAGIDVGEIASTIGGGGHRLAAGATVDIDNKNILEFTINLFSSIF